MTNGRRIYNTLKVSYHKNNYYKWNLNSLTNRLKYKRGKCNASLTSS